MACFRRSGWGPEAEPRRAPGSARSSSRFPQRAAPRRRATSARTSKIVHNFQPLSASGTAGRAAPQPAAGRGLCLCLPAPDRGPSAWQPQRSGLRAPASDNTRVSGPCAGGTEGEVKDGEEGRNFHLEEVWIWGGEGMGEPWNKEKEPLSPPWLTSFPSLSLRKKTLSFLPKPLVFRSLIYLQLINIPLIILPRPVYSLIPSNEASKSYY